MLYVTLVNAELHGDVDLVLTGMPQGIDLHWDRLERRSRLCLGHLEKECPDCRQFVPRRNCFYASCAYLVAKEEGNRYRPGLVQLPFGFVAEHGKKLVPGQWVGIHHLGVEGKRPYWEMVCRPSCYLTDLPEGFDVLEAMCRIKGVELPEASPGHILKFPTRSA